MTNLGNKLPFNFGWPINYHITNIDRNTFIHLNTYTDAQLDNNAYVTMKYNNACSPGIVGTIHLYQIFIETKICI